MRLLGALLFLFSSPAEALSGHWCAPLFQIPMEVTWTTETAQPLVMKGRNSFLVVDQAHSYYQFEGTLDSEGTLEVKAYLAMPSRGVRSELHGADLYRQMMEHFKGRVERIKVRWLDGTNYNKYIDARAHGASPRQAASWTWTGRQAAVYGFTRVESVRVSEVGAHRAIIVVYGRAL